jgi:hypothetical protein
MHDTDSVAEMQKSKKSHRKGLSERTFVATNKGVYYSIKNFPGKASKRKPDSTDK